MKDIEGWEVRFGRFLLIYFLEETKPRCYNACKEVWAVNRNIFY